MAAMPFQAAKPDPVSVVKDSLIGAFEADLRLAVEAAVKEQFLREHGLSKCPKEVAEWNDEDKRLSRKINDAYKAASTAFKKVKKGDGLADADYDAFDAALGSAKKLAAAVTGTKKLMLEKQRGEFAGYAADYATQRSKVTGLPKVSQADLVPGTVRVPCIDQIVEFRLRPEPKSP